MMGFGFLGMLLFWGCLLAVLVAGEVLVFRQTGDWSMGSRQRQPTARQMLEGRPRPIIAAKVDISCLACILWYT
jgi:hypothetical protein